jgi:hypothetical protein
MQRKNNDKQYCTGTDTKRPRLQKAQNLRRSQHSLSFKEWGLLLKMSKESSRRESLLGAVMLVFVLDEAFLLHADVTDGDCLRRAMVEQNSETVK